MKMSDISYCIIIIHFLLDISYKLSHKKEILSNRNFIPQVYECNKVYHTEDTQGKSCQLTTNRQCSFMLVKKIIGVNIAL